METSASNQTNQKIVFNFRWEGASTFNGGCFQGGSEIGVVDLVFKNAKSTTSVSIPDDLSPHSVKKLPFTFKKYRENTGSSDTRLLTKETQPYSLKATIEQIESLTIYAGIFTQSPIKGPATLDDKGKITYGKRVMRSDREVPFEKPKKLEMGQTYTLIVTSKDSSLSAHLEKESKVNDSINEPHEPAFLSHFVKKTEESNKNTTETPQQEFQKKVSKMAEELILEDCKTLS